VVGLKGHEEESHGKKSGKARGSMVLKAATAAGGRIVSTVANGEEPLDVPEEILAQMPEELLDSRDRLRGRHRVEDQDFDEDEDGDSMEEISVEVHGPTIAPKATLYEESLTEDEEPALAKELVNNISAVAEVFQEIGTSRTESKAVESEVRKDVDEEMDEEVSEPDWEPEVPESPFEAVEGPVSGVFTLKSKPESEYQTGTAHGEGEGSDPHARHGMDARTTVESFEDETETGEESTDLDDLDQPIYARPTVEIPKPLDPSSIRPNFQLVSRPDDSQVSSSDHTGEPGSTGGFDEGVQVEYDQLKIGALSRDTGYAQVSEQDGATQEVSHLDSTRTDEND
jgi:hypothetical protein